jgi:Tol biopolymer transport system component
LLLLCLACSDDPPSGPTEVQLGKLGQLNLSIRTTGGDVDVNGYEILIGTTMRRQVAANETLLITGLSAGTYEIKVEGLAANCSISGTNPRLATIASEATADIVFEIICAAFQKLNRLAFVLDSIAPGQPSRWIVLANEGQSTTSTLIAGESPDWSPDGTEIVFSEPLATSLVIINPVTHATRRLQAGGRAAQPDWSPAGDVIAFVKLRESSLDVARLYLLKLDGSPAAAIPTPGVTIIESPSWSPDGLRIAFTCSAQDAAYDVCVINRDGTGFAKLTTDGRFNGSPEWSPNGKMIAFDTMRFVSVWDYGSDIAVMAADGSGSVPIARGYSPVWSPDGSRLLFVGANGLFTVGLDGSNLTRVTAGNHYSPAWGPAP